MKKQTLLLSFCILCMAIISCSKGDTAPENNNNNNGGNNNGNGGGNSLPYFEYAIGTAKATHVDCSEIAFSAKDGELSSGVVATSASTKATFAFSFPAFSGAVEKLAAGEYPIKEFAGYVYGETFELSLRVPKISGGTDYVKSVSPSLDSHKNRVTSIEKGAVESNRQVYWINGEYNIPAETTAKESTVISGKYRFKILTLPGAGPNLAVLKTIAVNYTSGTRATVSAEAAIDGNDPITERGVAWSSAPYPRITNNKMASGTGTGSFTADITDLRAGWTYYIRAYATSKDGTSYGNELTLVMPPPAAEEN